MYQKRGFYIFKLMNLAALHRAAVEGDASVVTELLNAGADPSLKVRVDAVCFVYTCRRLIYRTMIAGRSRLHGEGRRLAEGYERGGWRD